jgi:hypothetical protein
MVLTMKFNCKKNNLLLIFANNPCLKENEEINGNYKMFETCFEMDYLPCIYFIFYFCIRLIRMLSFSSLFYPKNIENKYVTRKEYFSYISIDFVFDIPKPNVPFTNGYRLQTNQLFSFKRAFLLYFILRTLKINMSQGTKQIICKNKH